MSANVLATGTAPQPTNNHLSPSPLLPSRPSADSHPSEPGTSSVSTSTSSSISGSTSQHHTTSDNHTSPSSQSSRLSVEGCIAPQDPQASPPSHHTQNRQRRLSAARDGTPLPHGQEPERLLDNREQRAVSLTPKVKDRKHALLTLWLFFVLVCYALLLFDLFPTDLPSRHVWIGQTTSTTAPGPAVIDWDRSGA
jgi:hypothetical protein